MSFPGYSDRVFTVERTSHRSPCTGRRISFPSSRRIGRRLDRAGKVYEIVRVGRLGRAPFTSGVKTVDGSRAVARIDLTPGPRRCGRQYGYWLSIGRSRHRDATDLIAEIAGASSDAHRAE